MSDMEQAKDATWPSGSKLTEVFEAKLYDAEDPSEQIVLEPASGHAGGLTVEVRQDGTFDLSEEEIDRYALGGGDPLDRILDSLWCSATDLLTSDDFRDDDGELIEDLFINAKAGAIMRAKSDLMKEFEA